MVFPGVLVHYPCYLLVCSLPGPFTRLNRVGAGRIPHKAHPAGWPDRNHTIYRSNSVDLACFSSFSGCFSFILLPHPLCSCNISCEQVMPLQPGNITFSLSIMFLRMSYKRLCHVDCTSLKDAFSGFILSPRPVCAPDLITQDLSLKCFLVVEESAAMANSAHPPAYMTAMVLF